MERMMMEALRAALVDTHHKMSELLDAIELHEAPADVVASHIRRIEVGLRKARRAA